MNAPLLDLGFGDATFPEPRPFQQRAHDALRAAFKEGHKNQLIMAPTGAGKTYLGLRIAHEALAKGKRAVFVCDRTTLINQTSATADGYGLTEHGIIQADHWRANSEMLFQIASAQTLARRQWPACDVVIIDEAHTQLKVWVEYAKATNAAVIGLSATPFSPGLAKIFSNLINATTMHELTQSGVLVPMRVFTCTRPDMAGAKIVAGEWSDDDVEERGMGIIGDVVTEWARFAEGRKTIVFGATIKHCEEICRQFVEAGVMASVFTSLTTAGEREHLLKEYRRADSSLRVLVSVEALAKGFDVPDVGCVVDCRPLRKSLSTAIQMWGRGLRASPSTGKKDCLLLDHCIANGQRVLTHRGLVRIEEILLTDKLWDGHEFVTHKGVISRGIKPVIRYAGLTATADHPVKTAQGWRTLGHCAREQAAIITTGVGRTTIRERDDCFTRRDLAGAAGAALHACALRVRRLWVSLRDFAIELEGWAHERMQTLQPAYPIPEVAVRTGSWHEAALQQPEGQPLQGLRRERDRVPLCIGDYLRPVDQGQPRNPGGRRVASLGPNREQRALRAGQSSLGNGAAQSLEHAKQQVVPTDAQIQDGASQRSLRRLIVACVSFCRPFVRGNRGALASAVPQAEGEVWDVLDCGPRNSFTCEGLLVHNSGNILRFADDYTDIYFNGLDKLDAGEKLDKKVRQDDEDHEQASCPACKYRPFSRRCMACGFEIQTAALVEHEAGEAREVMLGKRKLADDKQHLYAQVCTYARANSAPEKQRGRAAHLFKDMTGDWPPRSFDFESTANVPITRNVANQIRSMTIRFVKGKAKGEKESVAA